MGSRTDALVPRALSMLASRASTCWATVRAIPRRNLRKTQNAPRRAPRGTSVEPACIADPKLYVTAPDQPLKRFSTSADHAGEDDLSYLRARPDTRTRIRSVFPGEFARKLLNRARRRQF